MDPKKDEADRRAAEEALAEYEGEGGYTLEQIVAELERQGQTSH